MRNSFSDYDSADDFKEAWLRCGEYGISIDGLIELFYYFRDEEADGSLCDVVTDYNRNYREIDKDQIKNELQISEITSNEQAIEYLKRSRNTVLLTATSVVFSIN